MSLGEKLEAAGFAYAMTDVARDTNVFFIDDQKIELPRGRVRLSQQFGVLCAKKSDVLEAAK